jgi:hypothetical protein
MLRPSPITVPRDFLQQGDVEAISAEHGGAGDEHVAALVHLVLVHPLLQLGHHLLRQGGEIHALLDGVLAHQARHGEAALILLEPAIALARALGEVPAQALHQARGRFVEGVGGGPQLHLGRALGGTDQPVDDKA